VPILLSQIAEEVANRPGNVWLPIISLRKEDAKRLGYDNAKQWKSFLTSYTKEGAEIIQDNVQDTIFGGFAPNSQTAEVLSKALGSRTVMSGSISKGKKDPSQSLQMIERPLMTPDELKSIPKGHFVVMKTGTHPMQTRLRLFLEWGISFGDPYTIPEKAAREVAYANKRELEQAINQRHYMQEELPEPRAASAPLTRGGTGYAQNRRSRREPPASANLRTDLEDQ